MRDEHDARGGAAPGGGSGGPRRGAERRAATRSPVASAGVREDEAYMRRCLELARVALAAGEVPVGAMVVRDGRVIGEGHERTRTLLDPAAHAEIEALRAGCRTLGSLDLSGATLYTTVEPCVLCAYALRHARIQRVVFGVDAGEMGGVNGRYPLLTDAALATGAVPSVVEGGVLAEECRRLLDERKRGA